VLENGFDNHSAVPLFVFSYFHARMPAANLAHAKALLKRSSALGASAGHDIVSPLFAIP
jgi:hypothetical protein